MIDKFIRKHRNGLSLLVFLVGMEFLQDIYGVYNIDRFLWFLVQEIVVVVTTCIYYYEDIVDRKVDKNTIKSMIEYSLILTVANFSLMYLLW